MRYLSDDPVRWVALVAAVAAGRATSPVRAAESDETATVRIASVCGSETQADTLVGEVRSRLPDRRVRHVGDDERADGSGVVWERGDDTSCQLRVTADSETTRLTLPADAEEASIRQAASRVAWLLTARRAVDPPESDEATDEDAESEREEPEPEPEPAEEASADEQTGDEGEDQSEEPEETERATAEEEDEKTDENSVDEEPEEGTESAEPEWRAVPAQWTLVPPLTYPSVDEPVAPWLAGHLIGTHHGVRGLEFGIVNVKTGFARGMQVAAAGNYVGGDVDGVQVALVGNLTRGNVTGGSIALGGNVASGVSGFQAAGLANVATAGLEGAQLAIGANWTVEDVRGVQAGMANVAGGVPGLQVGLLNVSRRVEGVQVGLLNVARKSEVSVGLLSVNWARPLYVSLWQDITGFSMVEFKHGSRRLHNIVVGGFNPFTDVPAGVVGLGLGMRLGQKPWTFDIDGIGMFATAASADPEVGPAYASWGQLRGTLQWSLLERFALMGGVSLNVLINDGPADQRLRPPPEIPSFQLDPLSWTWPGVHAGVRF